MSFSPHKHRRKNSHLFMEQATSGSSFRGDRSDFELDNLDIPPPLNSRTSDLENQDFILDQNSQASPFPSLGSSLESWYFSKKFGHNRKRITAILIGFLLVVFVLFVIPTFFVKDSSNRREGSNTNKNPKVDVDKRDRTFTIEDVFNGAFSVDSTSFRFIDPPKRLESHDTDPGLYLTLEVEGDTTNLVAKQLFDKQYKKVLCESKFTFAGIEYTVSTASVNYRLDRMILGTNIKSEFRHSSRALYWLKDIETGDIKPINPLGNNDEIVKLSYAKFSPSYNYIYFVHQNDLYFQHSYMERQPVRLTRDGSDTVFNAKPDWIYEEEVMGDEKAIWWAPDDSKFIFARFNDNNVDSYDFSMYTDKDQYPKSRSISYPKPGRPNPTVELFEFNHGEGVLYSVNVDEKIDKELVLYDAAWIDSNHFIFKTADRHSKHLSVKMYDTVKIALKTIRTDDYTRFNGWVDKLKKIMVIPPNAAQGRKEYGYVDVQPDIDGYNHLFYYASPDSKSGRQLTKGNWEITGDGIVGFEYDSNTVFFTANQIHPMGQHLYGVTLNSVGNEGVKTLQDPNSNHDFYQYELSSSCRYALMKMMGPGIPQTEAGSLYEVLKPSESELAIKLSNDANFKKTLERVDLPQTNYKTMKLDDGVEINYIEIKPANMNAKKKYPVLVNVYGGPGSQTFTTRQSILLEQSVASGLDAIVLQIEPRGTGGKGWSFRAWANRKLGYWEPRDVTEVTKKYMSEKKANIDDSKVAIWGWSYGGFTTLKTVEFDKGETFKYAIAVAPVTNWLYYDSIYTERYMDGIETNLDGYQTISVVNEVSSFKNLKRFMLIHGTADDNVHIQNTYEFVDKLNLNKLRNYDMHIFPDSDHSIRYHGAQRIIYEKIYYWLDEAFSGQLESIRH
ncbi:hypothetical protein KAFR_0H02630 [Kazachstania africana CBS 2517]|uniref:Dipeptidyl aminopeptidase A n=1 Tax=Kazachstania africana (strain ATCC 22294 / BCRC 22015 / CBS 2517 / CECT 1963 / NBRC 1671 / NRRL Y-8276) TaxID=1071382 RepID=H2AZB6_KAZAF|nr:hypothetical protein KAFR_0H02630 [Kazachstania africana CBS 2517]CCF59672.1 hypothetical protein KAFR_0H02630 [Kazachstania africana CBS 2517]